MPHNLNASPVDLENVVRVLAQGANFQAALHGLLEDLRLPAIAEMEEREKHAAAYETSAGVFRRRALKSEGETRAEHERRAVYYEGRARAMRSGQPMPRELRTPRERLEAVARVRDALVSVLDLVADVGDGDFEFFESSLIDSQRVLSIRGGPIAEQLAFVQDVARGVLRRLGAVCDEAGAVTLLPFGTTLSTPCDNAVEQEGQTPSRIREGDGHLADSGER